MALRPCLDCGALSPNTRCPDHARVREAEYTRRKREQRPYTNAEKERRAAAVAEHRAEYGEWCPGWQRPGHPSSDLTADHVVDVTLGGDESGELAVLCRPCNSAKGAAARG